MKNKNKEEEKGLHKEWLRFLLVAVWLLLLTIYGFYFARANFINDIFAIEVETLSKEEILSKADDKINIVSRILIMEQDSSNNSENIIKYEEIIVFKNKQAFNSKSDIESFTNKMDMATANKLSDILSNIKVKIRSTTYGPKQVHFPQKLVQKLWSATAIITGIICVLMGIIGGMAITTNRYQKNIMDNLSKITIYFILCVALIHASFVMLQGGLLVSPIGIIGTAILPILISQAIIAGKKSGKETSRRLIYSPPVLFMAFYIIAHLLSYYFITEASPMLLRKMFSNWYLGIYFVSILFATLAIITRINEDELDTQ